jgi:type IV pilus assembly protein PilO
MANVKELLDSVNAQFSDLNGVHPGLWPQAPRMLAAFVLLLAVLFLGWFFYWSSQIEELDTGIQEEQKLKEDFQKKMQIAVNLEALREQRKLVMQYVARMEKQLPSKSEMDQLLNEINSAASGRGLEFSLFEPNAVSVKEYYAELPFKINISGNYHDIGTFVADVAKLSRIVTLNNLSMKMKDDVITLDAIAKTFRYLDPEEIALQAEEKKKKAKEAKK